MTDREQEIKTVNNEEEPKANEEQAVEEDPTVSEEQAVVEEPTVSEETAEGEDQAAVEESTAVEETVEVEEPAETEDQAAVEEPAESEHLTADEEPAEAEEQTAVEEPAESEEQAAQEEPKAGAEKKAVKENRKKQKARAKKQKSYKKDFLKKTGKSPLSAITDAHDRTQDRLDSVFTKAGQDFVRGFHRISEGYMNSRRVIGMALLLTGLLVAAILIVFDIFTVYEYAYNGKVLGYVHEQEDVTDVLDIAGKKLSGVGENAVNIEFVANQNVTFNLVESKGKSTDDSDTVINKLIYMSDIETEAYAVCDGNRIVAIVKDQEAAENLLTQTMSKLSVPDRGMVLVSAEFVNELNIRPINVILGSIQSNATAQKQMIEGGTMETFHFVEEGETAKSLAAEFGVETIDIYDEDNANVAEEIEQGDKVCIRSTVDPVSVKMVETGRVKEIIEYETIKKETDEYYKGDTVLEQDGVDGVQIFEGTITKVAGVETDREESKPPEVLKEKQDKIILVGTTERPKTAATGTFIKPLEHFTMTSGFGPRWGTHHDGVDLAIGTGTPFVAADGGTVIRAGWYGGYGQCIDIEHEPGVVTRYGHCSQILVSAGDLVYQGQTIGLVGSTGWSTGPHLHFEVHINGSRVDPEAYVKFY